MVMDMENVNFLTETGSSYGSTTTADRILDKDDFLRLLVAKLSNQDPLNPVEDEDFVAQLAQFSSLEQLSNMNENLEQDIQWNYMLSQTISNTMATSLIGRTVRADSSMLYLQSGDAADLAVNLDRPATDLTITIRDENGNVVRTITEKGLDSGDHVFNWDGTNDSGVQVPSGGYTVSVTAVDVNGNEFTPDQFIEGKVNGITYRDGIALLNVNGQDLPLASVLEVKEG
jgi:flagellar basal-body rod modification protein FlgD